MSPESLYKVGRGGVGNFLSQKNLDEANKQSEDIEAQQGPDNLSEIARHISPEPSKYSRTGRGGSGNLVSASRSSNNTVSSGFVRSIQATEAKASELANSSRAQGYTGRGGAGNWQQHDEEEKRLEDINEAENRCEVDKRVKQEVEAGLSRPPRAYVGPEGKYADD
ncbi:MAG: hypothetical protein M1818_004708 [Claussenomyces sp. TS43310]|nr:MAG: hypothetical protein M1818_004708 [Claussenomyces sp. TS43310]